MPELDCWNEIGIWAQDGATCPKLETLIHCRNCSIYADAGRETLERSIPPETLLEYTTEYAKIPPDKTSGSRSVLVFRIGEEWLGLIASDILEITDIGAIHSVPHNRNNVLEGITCVRGELQIAVSLYALLGIDTVKKRLREGTLPVFPRLILMQHENQSFAFAVDDIAGIFTYSSEQFKAVPETLRKTTRRFVSNLISADGKQIGFLDAGLIAYGFSQGLH